MNRTNNHDSRYPGPRVGADDTPELRALMRQALDLRRELVEAELGLRNALQYIFLIHSRQQWPEAGAAPGIPSAPPTEADDSEAPGYPEGPELTRLRTELHQARAELAQLHRLLRTVLGRDGHAGAGARPNERPVASGGLPGLTGLSAGPWPPDEGGRPIRPAVQRSARYL
jgi:hypothetical protein